jgi:hypothetical protein
VLHRISEFLIAVVDYIPALFLEEHSPSFRVVRAMSLLIVVALVIAVFALIGHFRLKRVAHLKNSSRKNATETANSSTPHPPSISEHAHSVKTGRMS